MSNMLSRLLAICLGFLLLVFAPFSLSVLSDNISARYAIMNDVTNFTDEVADTRRITKDMLSNFYLDVASHGILLDVTVERYVRVVESDATSGGKLVTTYMAQPVEITDADFIFNSGDKVVVHVEPIGYSAPQRIVTSTIGQILPDFNYTFPVRVR